MDIDEKIYLFEWEKIEKLISIAKKDLESSKILFMHKKFSNSVLDFFQSVEKLSKASALMNKFMKYEDLQSKMGHNPLKIYKTSVLENIKKAEDLEEAIKKYPELKEIPAIANLDLITFKKNAEHAQEILKSVLDKNMIFSDKESNVKSLTLEMKELINKYYPFTKIKFDKYKYEIALKAIKNSIEGYVKLCKTYGKEVSESEKKELIFSKKNMKKRIHRETKNIIISGVMESLNVSLNLLLKPHFSFLRYPDTKDPIEYYDENNSLVKSLLELIWVQNKNIIFHKEYLKILKSYYENIIIEKD